MSERRRILRYALVEGEPVSANGVRVTPQARVLEVHWSGGGLVWNRPVALWVERDGQTTRMPIIDATRIVQIALGVFVALYGMAVPAGATRGMRGRHG